MTDNNLKSFFERNWTWILTVIFMTGFNYATINNRLENKISKEEARLIIKEELRELVYSKTDGKVLEARFDGIEKKIDELKVLLQSNKK